jgi:hypothetical protein
MPAHALTSLNSARLLATQNRLDFCHFMTPALYYN